MFGLGRAFRPRAVAFDVIGTLFPLDPLRTPLMGLGLASSALESWFATALRDAFALAAADGFEPFSHVLEAALDEVLAQHDLSPSKADRAAVLEGLEDLPARPDALRAFERLQAAGVRVLALSNGSKNATRALLKGARLETQVEHVLSVDDVKHSKPRPEIYQRAVKTAEVGTADLALVAIHPWDLNGAKAAGLVTGYLATKGRPYPKFFSKPDVEAWSLLEVVEALLALPEYTG